MGAPGEEIRGGGVKDGIAPRFQQRHIPGQGGRVAGYIHDPPGGEAGECLDGIGIQALPGRVDYNNICLDALTFQLQSRLARVTAEELRVLNAVAHCVVLGILDGLGNDLYADDLAGALCHGQGDSTHAAVQIQHRILLGDAGLGNGGLIQPLGLVVILLVEGTGGQAEV